MDPMGMVIPHLRVPGRFTSQTNTFSFSWKTQPKGPDTRSDIHPLQPRWKVKKGRGFTLPKPTLR